MRNEEREKEREKDAYSHFDYRHARLHCPCNLFSHCVYMFALEWIEKYVFQRKSHCLLYLMMVCLFKAHRGLLTNTS